MKTSLQLHGEDGASFHQRWLPQSGICRGKDARGIDAGVFGQAADSTPYIFSGELNINDEDDRTPPVIDNISHTRTTLYPTDSLIELRFSEPINKKYVSDAAVRIIANDSTYADINYRWLDNFSIDLLARGLEWGKRYKIMIAETLFYDLAGNRLGDSVVNYRFDTYNHDSLGSVAGKISFGRYLLRLDNHHLLNTF